MSNVIKINHIINDVVKNIYVFAGSIDINPESPWNINDGTEIFTPQEIQNITDNNIPVTIVNGFIHSDDTISTIKTKIIKYTGLRISVAELYLFGITTNKINPAILYNQLTQNDTLKLTKERICHFLLNIVNIKCDDINVQSSCPLLEEPRDIFDFEDLLSIDAIDWDEPISHTIPIGQKIVKRKQYPFVANPYNCTITDPLLIREYEQMITTQNLNLLFECGTLCNNNIYICLAEDVLEYANTIDDSAIQYMLNIYYPILRAKYNITTTEKLLSNKIKLYDEQQKLIDKGFESYNDRIDLLYNIYYNKTTDINYQLNSPGVLKLSFIIHPTQKINMPLETLFKLIHSSEILPMVKYNPGIGHENIYRFFTNAYAKNGKKIPYMYTQNNNSSRKLLYISKRIAKNKRVAYYIEYNYEDTQYAIDCEFETNGNIVVTTVLNKINPIENIEIAIKNAINPPLLEQIRRYLEQSGYTYQIFDGFEQSNVEITDLTLNSVIQLKQHINLDKYISCLSTIFTITDGELTGKSNELNMKYKRVSNYNELDSVETFINDLRKDGTNELTVIKKLVQNFNIDEGEARRYFAKWASQINVETDLFENKAIAIRTNTGFPVTIHQDHRNYKTVFQISSINNIGYIKPLIIYFDSMIRMISEPHTTSVSNELINEICQGEAVKEVMIKEDITVNKIRIPEDDEDVDAFLDIFATKKDVSKSIDDVPSTDIGTLGDFELGKQISENKGETKGVTTDTFNGIEFGLLSDDDDEESSGDDDIDMGDVVLGDLSQISPQTSDDVDDEEFGDIDFELLNQPSESTPEVYPNKPLQESPETPETKGETKNNSLSERQESKQHTPAVDMTGVPIKGNNNIFIAKKEKLQPTLFLKAPIGKYKAYSKTCPTQYSKQPVILTNAEKKYIDDKDNASGTRSYDEHVTYGTGDEKYHYICPRFWCLSDEEGKSRSMSLEEINEGGCGGWDSVIPTKARTVPKGKKIVEFTDDRFHKMGSNTKNLLVYKPMHPGFQDKNQHPNGLCVPCCFGKPTTLGPDSEWRMEINKKGNAEYYNKTTGIKEELGFPKDKIKYPNSYKPEGKSKHGDGPEYDLDTNGNIIMDSIKGENTSRDAPANKRMLRFDECNQDANLNKFSIKKQQKANIDEAPLLEAWPLNYKQVGYLSYPLQRFLGYNCRELCQQSLSNSHLKINKPCLLHKGVEQHDTQSFLSCIADLFGVASDHTEDNKELSLFEDDSLTLKQIKEKILKKINIDTFIALQNGDLVSMFQDLDLIDEIDIELYKHSNIYKTLLFSQGNDEKSNQLSDKSEYYLKRVISAFNSFGKYIEDDASEIDYTYMWDLISLPEENGGLFKDGLNLIIINSPTNDITSKIQVICPTNVYNEQIYDINRKTAIIFSQNGYYEPIYQYTKLDKRLYRHQKLFNLNTIHTDLPELEHILIYIWRDMQTKCSPLPSSELGKVF